MNPNRTPGRARPSRPGRAGFTLVEILLAISISMLILMAAGTFVFSSFMLLGATQNDPGLEHHKLGAAAYLNYVFSQAAPPASNTTAGGGLGLGLSSIAAPSLGGGLGGTGNTTGNATTDPAAGGGTDTGATPGAGGGLPTLRLPGSGASAASTQSNRITWGYPPGGTTLANPFLSFRLDDDNPLLVWEDGPRPPVTCWLYFRQGEGLSILWQTDQQRVLEPTVFQRTVVSPLVKKMTFHYYDSTAQTWSESDLPEKDTNGAQLLPDFITLVFEIQGRDEKISVRLPSNQSNQLLY